MLQLQSRLKTYFQTAFVFCKKITRRSCAGRSLGQSKALLVWHITKDKHFYKIKYSGLDLNQDKAGSCRQYT